ncbi:MAG: hypothetical protein ABI175_14610 [Polyangiales bacterium]
MVRSSKSFVKLVVALGVTAGCLAAVPSCRDNNETLFIRQLQAPVAPDCVPNSDATSVFIARGVMDAGLSTRYFAFALVGNQLVARGDFRTTRAEPNRVAIKGADVHLFDGSGGELLFYSVVATGIVDPTTSADPGYGIAALELIPHVVGTKISAQLAAAGGNTVQTYEARFRVFGETLGGTEVTSNEYVFPIDVCYGCTVSFPSDSQDKTRTTPNCLGTTAATATVTPGQTPACFAGQDGVTDCRNCRGNPICTPCADDSQCGGRTCGTAGHCI